MHQSHDLVGLCPQSVFNLLGVHGRSPLEFEGVHCGAEPSCQVLHPQPKDPVDQDQYRIILFNKIYKARFHACRPGP